MVWPPHSSTTCYFAEMSQVCNMIMLGVAMCLLLLGADVSCIL